MYWVNAKENGNYYLKIRGNLRMYWDNGKENGKYIILLCRGKIEDDLVNGKENGNY